MADMRMVNNKPKFDWMLYLMKGGVILGFIGGVCASWDLPFFEGFSIGPPPPPTAEDIVWMEIFNACLKVFVVLLFTSVGFCASCLTITLTVAVFQLWTVCRELLSWIACRLP